MVVGCPWLLPLLLAACCACCASGVRIVKRKEQERSVSLLGEKTSSDCEWKRHDNMFSNGYAVDPSTLQPVLDRLSFEAAQSRCLQVGSACQAVTCAAAGGNTCTLRATAVLQPSANENTWVPACHACHNLAGVYWSTDISNSSDYETSLAQSACSGSITVSQQGFSLASRNYVIDGDYIVSWNPWFPPAQYPQPGYTNGTITGYPGAYLILWTDGWTSLQCPWVQGVYLVTGGGFTPSQIAVAQTASACAGTWSPSAESWQTTAWYLLPNFKIETTFSGVKAQGNLVYDADTGFWLVQWGTYTWQQLDESTTTMQALWR